MTENIQQEKEVTEEMLKRACPAVFGELPATEITPRYVAFVVPPEVFGPIRKWLDQGGRLEIFTGSNSAKCQIYISNSQAVEEYNKGRDPSQGYPKDWKQ